MKLQKKIIVDLSSTDATFNFPKKNGTQILISDKNY